MTPKEEEEYKESNGPTNGIYSGDNSMAELQMQPQEIKMSELTTRGSIKVVPKYNQELRKSSFKRMP